MPTKVKDSQGAEFDYYNPSDMKGLRRRLGFIGSSAALVFVLSVGGAYALSEVSSRNHARDEGLLNKCTAIADRDGDGVLDNRELAGMLREMGYEGTIVDNEDKVVEIGDKTSVKREFGDYKIKVSIGREDAKKYIDGSRE